MADKFFLGENAQSFKTAPKFNDVDMVILNIDENNYISSPYVQLDEEQWEASWQRRSNGKYEFIYDPASNSWKRNSAVADLADCGITAIFNVAAAGPKSGDKITVNRFGKSEDGSVEHSIELTRSGHTIEANCPIVKPSARQNVADNLLASLSGYRYQPFSATSAEVNPLMELGDGITAHGVYAGMYQQDLNFESLMTSDIGAPSVEETDYEYQYQSASERKYTRKFADIAAEFNIQSDLISAKVEKTGGDRRSFRWELVEDSWTVYATNREVFKITSGGASVTGTIRATDGVIGGFTIGSSSIYNLIDTFGSEDYWTGVYLGTNGIQLGRKFKVDSWGKVTASDLAIVGGSISLGSDYEGNPYFSVSNSGYVTAKRLTADGMSARNASFTDCAISGNLTDGGRSITAYELSTGAQSAYNNGSNWSSAFNWTNWNGSYCITGSGYGYDFDSVTSSGGSNYVNFLRVNTLYVYRFFVPGVGTFRMAFVGNEAKLVRG